MRLFALMLFATALEIAAADPEFQRDIQPLFEARCLSCHGAEKQKGGVRLDRKADAFRETDSGKLVIVRGKPEESRLFQMITAPIREEAMPPKGERLSATEVELIRSWIQNGAVWPDDGSTTQPVHWAYVKPVRPELPRVTRTDWPRNWVDHFVLAQLEREGLAPSPESDRQRLLRRLALDLTGLPPTLEEVERFTANTSEELWEQAVDYYLASPHYGEQRAALWLDLARYADSHGYEKDPGREMWLYRDWVIDAFNRNMPFDQFTLEQIAGDMLTNATISQKIASGFHRNTMFNTEGGVDREEARVETIVDRVNTTATVWLGSTLACAQCHTHKYDPFSIKEYYQFFAYFNNVEEPELEVPSAEQAEKRKVLREEIAALEARLNTETQKLTAAQASWEYRVAEQFPQFTVLEPTGFLSAGGATLTKLDDQSILGGGLNPSNDRYTVVATTDSKRITGFRLEVFPDDSLPNKSLGRHPNGSFVLSKFEVLAAPRNEPKRARPITFKAAVADFTQSGHSAANLINDKAGPGWATSAGNEKMRVPRYVLFQAEQPVEFEEGVTLTFTLRNDSQWGEANLGRFRISYTTSDRVVPDELPPVATLKILATAPIVRTPEQKKELAGYYRSIDPELQSTRDQLADARKTLDDLQKTIPRTLVMREKSEGFRETRIHIRGNFMNKGDLVQPGVPAILHPIDGTNRIALARWLTSPQNPLTARVMVNRFWAQIFGKGLVETEEDFGTQGAAPSNPDLLDYLATHFMETGWDIKQFYKNILMSATYRQSSRVTPELLERDPDNRLLARGPRFRVNAESVRDITLTSSGLLERAIGGPSVYPYQPEGIWTQIYGSDKWVISKGGQKFRRGLYTYWKRTSPYPAFMSFDAPSREYCTARRPRTNTPLQALTTLNDPAYVEAAQALAQRILNTAGTELDEQIDVAFRLVLARSARSEERERLKQLFATEYEHYSHDKKAAELMGFGAEGKCPDQVDPAKAAAWTVLANVLLNLDETITKS